MRPAIREGVIPIMVHGKIGGFYHCSAPLRDGTPLFYRAGISELDAATRLAVLYFFGDAGGEEELAGVIVVKTSKQYFRATLRDGKKARGA